MPLGAARGTQAPGTSWLPRPRLISPHALVPVVKTLWHRCGAQRTPIAWPVHRAHTVREGPTQSLGPWPSAWLCGGEWPPAEHKASAKTEEGEGRTFRQGIAPAKAAQPQRRQHSPSEGGTAPAKVPRPLAREMGLPETDGIVGAGAAGLSRTTAGEAGTLQQPHSCSAIPSQNLYTGPKYVLAFPYP